MPKLKSFISQKTLIVAGFLLFVGGAYLSKTFYPFNFSHIEKDILYDWWIKSLVRDAGIVMISKTDGIWEQIHPVGGYPFTIYSSAALPFASGAPCYSGTSDWSQATFDSVNLLNGVKTAVFFSHCRHVRLSTKSWLSSSKASSTSSMSVTLHSVRATMSKALISSNGTSR